jgi:hypothetical protein
MKQTLCLIALFSVLGASTALANMNDSKARKMDHNMDGVISQSEKDAHMQQYYKEADANRDGQVSHDEWAIYNTSKKDQFTFAGQREDQNMNRYQYKDLPLMDYRSKWEHASAENYNRYSPAAGAAMATDRANRSYDYDRADGSDRNSDPQRSPYNR